MPTVEVASLVLRVLLGLTMMAHGYNHVLGPGGINGTARWFGSMGLRPPRLHAMLSGFGELAAGFALIAGLFTPFASAFVVGTMLVAGVIAHRSNGFFVFKDGYEYVLILAVVALCVALIGAGTLSLDHVFGISRHLDGLVGAVIAGGLGLLGAATLLAAFWRPVSHRERASA